jgi:hypothetical protein
VVGDAYNASNNLIGTRGRGYVNTAMTCQAVHGLRGESNVTNGATVTAAYGVYGDASAVNGTTVGSNYGLYARGFGGTSAFGTYGYAEGETATTTAIGAKGYAVDASNTTIGIDGFATATQGTKYGARASASGAGTLNYGLNANASRATTNYGIYSSASGGTTSYGIYATASGATTNWAAYFVGAGWITGGIWTPSDALLKQNVVPLTDASSTLAQLDPKRYQFRTNDFPHMGLPEGTHDGIMADDLQAVLPDLVRPVIHPAKVDSMGNVIHPAVELLAVNYDGLIPVLVAATNEHTNEMSALQDQVSQLQQQLAALQQDLATCCAAHGNTDGRSMSPGAGAGAGAGAGEALRTDLFIVPNPVADHTQLRYTVATPGRTRLEVSDAGGKRLEVLEEAVREAGAYTHDWTTTDLAPGTYHVTLFLNDSFVVKKAVKVGR